MTLAEALKIHLRAHVGLSALVNQRVHQGKLPAKCALPAVAFKRISHVPAAHTMVKDPSLTRQRWQISSWAKTPDDAEAVDDQVRAALRDHMGLIGGEGGVTIQRAFLESTSGPEEDEDTGYQGVKSDYDIGVD